MGVLCFFFLGVTDYSPDLYLMSLFLPSSTTPGGSIFSTTPGGTRIYYDRETVLLCKNSPIARSPPSGLICRPGVTCPLTCQGECNLPRMSANEQKPIATSDQHANQSTHKGKLCLILTALMISIV